jgi:8-oxo-dGTP pyrophosphatase MutT (NUDIX family)
VTSDFDTLDDPEVEVWAAGGIVLDCDGLVLVVHRPRYDDWTLPKGKLDGGETLSACALREVYEETGYRCMLGDPAAVTSYVDHQGRRKQVRYWHMRVVEGAFEPNDEVDTCEWLTPRDAANRLTYARDLEVLAGGV